ncbi:MAG TPA: AI-2E family transporter [Xanthobacteraceae bacterium]|jgi:predicted PurR-regulated permease PerM|nr:AI-2E family transporter [Xanthobacteraceae bacterium]
MGPHEQRAPLGVAPDGRSRDLRTPLSRSEFVVRCFIAIAIALVPVLVWYLFDVILIAIAALLISALLELGADPLMRWLKAPRHLALAISGLVILAIVAGTAYLFGSRMAVEFQDVLQRAASGQSNIVNSIQSSNLGKMLLGHVQQGVNLVGLIPSVFKISAGLIGALLVAVVAGVFFAAQPNLYLYGLVQLFPPRLHREVEETIVAVGTSLRLWLLGQLIEMVMIGALSTLAVWMIGLPSFLALGLIAGIAEFIPYVGPIIAAIPAILVAATQGFDAVIWTIVAYLLIHQAEGHVVMPFIQRYMVFIPPAVILLGIAAIGSLFGVAAIPLASPLAVLIFVLVKKLYVRDTLGEETPVPGEEDAH